MTLGNDFDGVIAARPSELATSSRRSRFRPGTTATSFHPSSETSRRSNRLFADANFVLSGALLLGIKAWVSFDKSGLALGPDGSLLGNEPYRKDIRVYAGIFGEYRFKAWLALFGRVGYLADFTDFQYIGTDPLLESRQRAIRGLMHGLVSAYSTSHELFCCWRGCAACSKRGRAGERGPASGDRRHDPGTRRRLRRACLRRRRAQWKSPGRPRWHDRLPTPGRRSGQRARATAVARELQTTPEGAGHAPRSARFRLRRASTHPSASASSALWPTRGPFRSSPA